MTNPLPLQDEAAYQQALRELSELFNHPEPTPGTPEAERYNTLIEQVCLYEADHFPIR